VITLALGRRRKVARRRARSAGAGAVPSGEALGRRVPSSGVRPAVRALGGVRPAVGAPGGLCSHTPSAGRTTCAGVVSSTAGVCRAGGAVRRRSRTRLSGHRRTSAVAAHLPAPPVSAVSPRVINRTSPRLFASNRGVALLITPARAPHVWKVAFQTFNVRKFTLTGRGPEFGRKTGRRTHRRNERGVTDARRKHRHVHIVGVRGNGAELVITPATGWRRKVARRRARSPAPVQLRPPGDAFARRRALARRCVRPAACVRSAVRSLGGAFARRWVPGERVLGGLCSHTPSAGRTTCAGVVSRTPGVCRPGGAARVGTRSRRPRARP
jgi:hypothetical protein